MRLKQAEKKTQAGKCRMGRELLTFERLTHQSVVHRSYNGASESLPKGRSTMNPFSLTTPEQVSKALADRVRALRLARGWKQITLAKRSGVSLASLRRFEESGRVSLQSLLKLAFALNRLDDFESLLQPPPASSLAELEAAEKRPPRKRGRV
jgi:ribosome-binding protein aMBF1 (putative translation factor)